MGRAGGVAGGQAQQDEQASWGAWEAGEHGSSECSMSSLCWPASAGKQHLTLPTPLHADLPVMPRPAPHYTTQHGCPPHPTNIYSQQTAPRRSPQRRPPC